MVSRPLTNPDYHRKSLRHFEAKIATSQKLVLFFSHDLSLFTLDWVKINQEFFINFWKTPWEWFSYNCKNERRGSCIEEFASRLRQVLRGTVEGVSQPRQAKVNIRVLRDRKKLVDGSHETAFASAVWQHHAPGADELLSGLFYLITPLIIKNLISDLNCCFTL